ncbi:hypothetical protein OBBRIDRAFT_889717 [Obba rivulosa]|uniref:Uncharacterized protein n=1 Tax=Obba rivulosa TaxID=1052685 RepID=A0A8E2DM33_9APHY|nr:hypothetical protein OBBRIDRAFT_889717 [Obba rivulosa]
MDDLYQNAWSTTNESDAPFTGASAWTAPKLSVTSHDEEADLAAPSWATGADIRWDEPSESAGFSWTQAEPDLAWKTSTYEDIQIAKPPEPEPSPSPPEGDDALASPVSERPATPTLDIDLHTAERELSPPVRSGSPMFIPKDSIPTPPDSPDAFGTFTSGFTAEQPASAFSQKDFAEDAWSSPWASADSEAQASQETEPLDEWEAARQQKAKQDRRVPPELLATILAQCDEFVREAWPESKVKDGDAGKQGESSTGKDTWRDNWRSGLEGVDGLEAYVNTLLPPLSLQPPVQFRKTAIAKKMATSVRLTKNLPLTKGSPMSHYLAAKGSIAWEVSVKERKETVEEDVVPVGWRILEKEPATSASADANRNKAGGRLFSFWGRRTSTVPETSSLSPEAKEQPSSTPAARTSSPSPSVNITHSRSGSMDSAKPSIGSSTDKISSSSTSPLPTPAAPQMSSYAIAPDPIPERIPTPPAAAPSAVSRFLNRFSRRSSTPSGHNSRHSLALSSDDLEFLSDIVPSAHDDADDAVEALKQLSAMKSPPLPPILPPPPPPPPPLAAPSSKATALIQEPQAAPQLDDDFDAFFGASVNEDAEAHAPLTLPLSSRSNTSALQPMIIPPPVLSVQSLAPGASLKPESRSSSPVPLSFIGSALDRPASQPPLLPPPPSSRPHTPISPANSTGSSRPKLPSPITLPPPPSRSPAGSRPTSAMSSTSQVPSISPTSPISPSSSRPLAELYPHVQQSITASARNLASFALPPPPAPKPQPRINSAVPFAYADVLTPDSAISPHQSTSLLSSFNSKKSLDEDEFSDFYSSPVATSRSSLSMAPLMRPSPTQPRVQMTFPAANHSRQQPSRFSLPPLTAPSPPSTSRNTDKLAPPPRAPTLDTFDDDEFSEFHSSGPSPAEPPSTQPFDVSFSFSSDHGFLTPDRTSGFEASTPPWSPLPSPSPPRPPSKSPGSILPLKPPEPPAQQHKPPPVQQQQSQPAGPSTLQRSSSIQERRKADRQHTLTLMERAAARPGRWPAPPSPLPEAIPMPGAGMNAEVDLLGGADVLHDAAFLAPIPPRVGSVPPPAQMQSTPSLDLFGSPLTASRPNSVGPSVMNPTPAAPAKGSGLSAQDLSFFEGL